MKRILSSLLILLLLFAMSACSAALPQGYWEDSTETTASFQLIRPNADTQQLSGAGLYDNTEAPAEAEQTLPEDGQYDSKDEVAIYIHLYGHLPSNYITKKEAEALGWTGGSLEPYAPGCSIGGGFFGNYEGILPEAKGRKYTECDIDTAGKRSRGAKRIVFSNDGLIFYTDDHYESFTLLYGEAEGW